MRYRSPHAAEGGRAPLALRGPKSARTAVAAVVAGAIGFVPAVMLATPAFAISSGSTLSSPTVVEGQDLVFTFTYNGTAAATFNLAFGGGPSTASSNDYTAPTNTTLTFGASANPQTATFTVKTTDDKTYEPDETLQVVATNAGDGTDTATGLGTIQNNDDAPTYTVTAAPNPAAEDAGFVTLTAKLSAASGMDTTINFSTTDGTAKAATNYLSNVTPVVILAGDTTGTTQVAILNDHVHDAVSPMTFTVNGSGDNVTGRYQNAQIGITDVTPMPKLTLVGPSPSTTAEGSSAVWTVNSDYASATPITVNWDALPTTPASGHAAATAGDDFDYPSTGRTVTIPAGAGNTSQTFSIPISEDNLNELPEDYTIGLSSPANATLGAISKAVGTISSATAAPTVSVTPTTVTEGDSGKRTQTFTATLSAKSGRTVTVDWNTADGSAWQGYDYVATSGVLTFPAGTTTQTFTVDIIGDNTYEPGDETFKIQLAAPSAESPPSLSVTADSTITITDDDQMPTATVGDISVKEGDETAPVLLPIKLSNPTSQPVVVSISDTPVAPTSNSPTSTTPGANDYTLVSTTVTIPSGQLTGYGVVLVNGDMMYEPDEVTNLSWSATHVATPFTGTAKFTILNDDNAPNLEVNSIVGREGDTVDVTGTVTGWSQDETRLTVTFTGTSVNGKAAASADDFVNPGGSPVYIDPGTAPGTVLPIASIKLNDDDTAEPAETILASGIGTNNVGTVTDGAITILPSDGGVTPPPVTAPTISVPAMVHGAATVKVTGKATAGATVDIWGGPWTAAMPALTKIGSAKAGSDGMYSFNRWIGAGYRFKAAVGDAVSAVVKTGVTQMPVFTASSPSKGMVSLAVQGNPRASGQTVIVQRWANGGWVNTWRGTTGSDNMWKATAKEPSKSMWTLRAFVAGNTAMGLYPGYSASTKVTVK